MPGWLSSAWFFWLAASVPLTLGAWFAYRGLLHDRPHGRLRCPRCWYDMAGSPGLVCPECGHDAKKPKRLRKTRRRWGVVALGAAIVAATLYTWPVHQRMIVQRDSLRTAVVPTTALILAVPFVDAGWMQVLDNRFYPPGSTLYRWQEAILVRTLAARVRTAPGGDRSLWWMGSLIERHDSAVVALSEFIDDPDAAVRAEAVIWLYGSGDRLKHVKDRLLAVANQPEPPIELLLLLSQLERPSITRLDDEPLATIIGQVLSSSSFFLNAPHWEGYCDRLLWMCLDEAVARGPRLATALRQRHEEADGTTLSAPRREAVTLMALRRIEGKPDPLRVDVLTHEPIVWTRSENATLDALLTYQDAEGAPIAVIGPAIADEAGYWWPWRVGIAEDVDIPLASPEDIVDSLMREHTAEREYLFGAGRALGSVQARLDLGAYLVDLPPGEYTLTVSCDLGTPSLSPQSHAVRLIVRD